jgi:hypothetical protein
MPDQNIN